LFRDEISGFRRGVNEIFALLRCYAALTGSYRRSWYKKPSKNVKNYQSTLHNIPEEGKPRDFVSKHEFVFLALVKLAQGDMNDTCL
jgi:hypothetical protein